MSKKRPSQASPIDIPPVPKETRFMSEDEVKKSSHFDHWITDLVGFDYQEVPLNSEQQGNTRCIKIPEKRLAYYFIDSLYIPQVNRNSAIGLMPLNDGLYFTIYLAIASPETIKAGVHGLRQLGFQDQLDTKNSASPILSYLLKLQTPNNIVETFRYEHFILNEILGGSPWGRELFAAMLFESQAPLTLLTDWQQALLPEGGVQEIPRGASQLFISLFASHELKNSHPKLATFSESIIPSGIQITAEQRPAWKDQVITAWVELLLQEIGSIPVNTTEEVIKASNWLIDVIEGVIESNQKVQAVG